MDETEAEGVMTVGERLREAREAKGLSVEDIAAQTRIPTRHLSSLETSEWDKLPAPTYSVGFAKNYAGAVGLDRNEIGDQLRAEMGGYGSPSAHPEIYEAVDPARTMPKGLVFVAIGLLVLAVIGFTWLSNRSLESEEVTAEPTNVATPAANSVAAPPAPAPVTAAGPVVLTATDAVWIEVRDGSSVLMQRELAAGERYEVPATASAPVLTTGKPEALRITVGPGVAPPVGPPGERVSRISLIGADLMRGPQAQATTNPAPPAPTARRAQPAPPPVQSPDPAPPGEVNAAAPAPAQ